ncbi:MAG: M28 family peptidase [Verrucomicrobiota bacterium]
MRSLAPCPSWRSGFTPRPAGSARPAVLRRLAFAVVAACLALPAFVRAADANADARATLRRFYDEALARGHAYENLRTLVTRHPGRLSGSKNLAGAVGWAETTLNGLGLDRVYKQDVMVPHWERGARENVIMLGTAGEVSPLSAVALGGSVGTGEAPLVADVVEVKSLDEVVTLGSTKIQGKIVFFNRPLDPTTILASQAYSGAVDQRSRGPGVAGKYGAVGALVRSMTHALDDLPHTGGTTYPVGGNKIPAAALSTLAADRLSAAIAAAAKSGGAVRIAMKLDCRTLPDAPSHNVIGEIKGSEFPDEVILVGGHLDSWDIAPGAHDNGSGVVQSIEVLRLFRTLGIKPRHTLRCVLFTNEENGLRGSAAYATSVKEKKEKHLLAVETDNGGFLPRGFNLGSTQGDAHERAAAKWGALFEPYGIVGFRKGTGGADVGALLVQGVPVAGLTPDSPRYFDIHHTTADSLDKVNPRELHLGAAALASLIWLVDTQGL